MNYLDLLIKLREAGQTAEKYKRELLSIAETGNPQHHHVAGLKAAYMRAETEFRRLKDQANEIINTAEDVELMRALYLRRVHRVPWEEIGRKIASNRSEMDLRQAAFLYIKRNYVNWGDYSDCF